MKRTLTALASAVVLTAGAQAAHAAPAVVADWQMNEPAGTTVMTDSAGSHNGSVTPATPGTTHGVLANGSYYHWAQRCPACAPVDATRVITVPDSPDLDIPDPSVPYTLEFRYRTNSGFGNIMQKGQSASAGGQIKVQLPGGKVQCLFKGANGVRVGAGTGTSAFSDGQWHTVRCVHTAAYVETWVDGVRLQRKNGSTGPIDNSKAFTVGGKLSCDQQATTCDYYSGDIDWIRVTRG